MMAGYKYAKRHYIYPIFLCSEMAASGGHDTEYVACRYTASRHVDGLSKRYLDFFEILCRSTIQLFNQKRE
jgi:hypothetical protein